MPKLLDAKYMYRYSEKIQQIANQIWSAANEGSMSVDICIDLPDSLYVLNSLRSNGYTLTDNSINDEEPTVSYTVSWNKSEDIPLLRKI